MGKEYYYRLIGEYNVEIEANNRQIRDLKEKLGELNPIYNAACEYGAEFSNQQIMQKTRFVDAIRGMIECGRYSNNILNGLGHKISNVMSEAGTASMTALANVEDRIQ